MRYLLVVAVLFCGVVLGQAQTTAPAGTDKLPFVRVDLAGKRVLVECEAVNAKMPLEFLCVLAGTAEHETILRTQAKPSHIHAALLMIGMKAGEPVRYSEAAGQWLPPRGAPVQIQVEFERNGRRELLPAYKLFRDANTKKPMPPRPWVFVGSKIHASGQYAADLTGYVASIVNFDLSLIDVPWMASNANETLEFEVNPDTAPPDGAKVTMILQPAGEALSSAVAPPAPATTREARPHVSADQVKIHRLREQWKQGVASRAEAMKDAATEHYRIVSELRAEQNRLIDEAERIGRVIDQLEESYQGITTPRPATQPAK